MFIKKLISFIVAHIFLLLGPNTQVYVAPIPATVATTTEIVMETRVKTKATTTIQTKSKTVKTTPKITEKTPVTTPIETQIVEPTPSFELINTFARQSVVNILCTTKGGELSPISGTGILVKPDGLILTNAHVGQYLLIKDYRQKDFIECVARTGSPAYPKYKIELVYISPMWVASNKRLLLEQNPTGTGENDFAFLRITTNIDGSNVSNEFSHIPMNVREIINKNEPVLLASYPAGFLGGLSILKDLNIVSAITSIQDVFTFDNNTIDLISVPGTVVSQKGSSGGAVVDKYGTLLGIISTSSDGNSTKDRDLRAITIAYINRDLQKELGITLDQFVNQDSAAFAKKFQEINAPNLTKTIIDELNKN